MMKIIEIRTTQGETLVDITEQIKQLAKSSKIRCCLPVWLRNNE